MHSGVEMLSGLVGKLSGLEKRKTLQFFTPLLINAEITKGCLKSLTSSKVRLDSKAAMVVQLKSLLNYCNVLQKLLKFITSWRKKEIFIPPFPSSTFPFSNAHFGSLQC